MKRYSRDGLMMGGTIEVRYFSSYQLLVRVYLFFFSQRKHRKSIFSRFIYLSKDNFNVHDSKINFQLFCTHLNKKVFLSETSFLKDFPRLNKLQSVPVVQRRPTGFELQPLVLEGIVRMAMRDASYLVEDITGYVELKRRDDVIADADDDGSFDTAGTYHVIALHPGYEYSYCPGEATNLSSKGVDVIEVSFYDGTCGLLPREEVFPISREKYLADVEYIELKEEEMVGQVVVAGKDGVFLIGESFLPCFIVVVLSSVLSGQKLNSKQNIFK